MHKPSRISVLFVWMAISSAIPCPAEIIRLVSWDFGSTYAEASTTNRLDLTAAAAELKRLDPDVILLQHVSDWATCDRLALALRPTDYKVTVCSSFAQESAARPKDEVASNAAELELSYSNQIGQAQAELNTAKNELAQSQAALGPVGQELANQANSDWADVTPATVKTYQETAAQIEVLGEQERDLRRRGYKEGHLLVQAVRAELRDFSTRKAELERNSPPLKYIVVGTNAPNWALAAQLKQYKALRSRVSMLTESIESLERQVANVEAAQSSALDISNRNRLDKKVLATSEVAILAKDKAYFSWSRRFELSGADIPGGFVFGALQLPKRRVGFFSVGFGDGLATGTVRQLLTEIGSIRKWEQNQVDTFVIACTVGTGVTDHYQALRAFNEAGYSDALAALMPQQATANPATVEKRRTEFIFVESTTLPLNSQPGPGGETGHSHEPAVCDLELDPAKVAASRLARVEAQTSASLFNRKPENVFPVWTAGLLFAGALLLGLSWLISRRSARGWRKGSRLLPIRPERGSPSPSSYTVIVAPTSMTGSAPDPAALPPVVPTVHIETPGPAPTHSGHWQQRAMAAEDRAKHAEALVRQGLLPHLSQWMKEKIFRKLVTDRRQLLAAQEEATRKVIAVDARLNKLELQIQQQTRAYVKRIEELTAELLAAKEENRQLIRAKIAQVKIEMEAARKKLLDEGAPQKTSNRDT